VTDGFTQTGMAEMRQSIEQFSDDQTAALKAVARATAERILSRERQLLASQTHGEGNTADALFIEEDAANKQFIVRFGLIKKRTANLPLWLEYGTVHMTARPFVRPAADAEKERYRRDMETASASAASKTFGD
jgi:HK97 gp10 family phage protein